jgi:hypothetical protein
MKLLSRRAAHVCADTGASPSRRDLHTPCSSRDTIALPGHGRRRASAGPRICVPPPARRDSGETCTPRAAHPPGRAYVCRHRRVAIAARPARPAQLTRRVRPPRPRPAESQRRTARVCRHRRVANAARPALPAQLTRRVRPPPPRPAESQRRAARVCAATSAATRSCTRRMPSRPMASSSPRRRLSPAGPVAPPRGWRQRRSHEG